MFVSVIMPVYNGGAYLRGAVESVLDQTHRDLELVVVDDGSTDGSRAVLERLAAGDARVRIISQSNQGAAAARNTAIAAARAEWLVHLDADDLMLANRIERQLAFLASHPGVKVFASRAYYIDPDGRSFGVTKCEPFTTPARFAAHVAAGLPIGINHPSAMLHRPTIQAAGGYRSAHEPSEDLDLWNRLAEQGHVILQQEEVLTKYRVHGASLITSRTRHGWEVGDWTLACMRARRAGQPEPTKAGYAASLRRQPWWRRLARESLMQARVNYRIAGFAAARRDWPKAIGCTLVAGLARPHYVASRLASQLIMPRLPARWSRLSGHDPASAEL